MVSSPNTWSDTPVEDRIRRVCALRHVLAEKPQPFLEALRLPFRRSDVESIAAELIPLADACAFLEKNAVRLLKPKRLGMRGRAGWLWGVSAEIHRDPLGTVLIIAPGNYPLMLSGIQAVQALVAGNRVLLKPAPGTRDLALLFADTLKQCGVPTDALLVLEESPAAVKPWLGKVDKVILTGAEGSGRAVMRDLAEHLTPSIMELSGCDPVIVLPSADLDLTAKCIRFGLSFNGSNSCIAPRRLLVHRDVADKLVQKLTAALSDVTPLPVLPQTRTRLNELGQAAVDAGAKMIIGKLPCDERVAPTLFDFATDEMKLLNEDVAAPIASIVRINDSMDALSINTHCRFSLGAAVFGEPNEAAKIAEGLRVGVVVINDLMAPTADARLPFGGMGSSGFGVTRGSEGLLSLTRVKAVTTRKHGPRFHLMKEAPQTIDLLRAQLQASHASTLWARATGLIRLLNVARKLQKENPDAR